MKKLFEIRKAYPAIIMVLILVFISACSASDSQYNMNTTNPGSYDLNELNIYGDWIHVEPYGEVWQPFVVNGWAPFDNGHWDYTNAGWTWVSYEPFGWIVYHYGYWYNDPFYGWVWLPSDNFWSPARVTWIDYDDYVGWAPIPPPGIVYGNPWEMNENHHWHVVRHKDFTEDNIRSYTINNPIRNESGSRGITRTEPDKFEIQKYVNKPIQEVKLKHETVTLPPRQINKMNLPKEENKRVEQHTSHINREVLVPREEFVRQHNNKAKK